MKHRSEFQSELNFIIANDIAAVRDAAIRGRGNPTILGTALTYPLFT